VAYSKLRLICCCLRSFPFSTAEPIPCSVPCMRLPEIHQAETVKRVGHQQETLVRSMSTTELQTTQSHNELACQRVFVFTCLRHEPFGDRAMHHDAVGRRAISSSTAMLRNVASAPAYCLEAGIMLQTRVALCVRLENCLTRPCRRSSSQCNQVE
jgi:hypothetical protein